MYPFLAVVTMDCFVVIKDVPVANATGCRAIRTMPCVLVSAIKLMSGYSSAFFVNLFVAVVPC